MDHFSGAATKTKVGKTIGATEQRCCRVRSRRLRRRFRARAGALVLQHPRVQLRLGDLGDGLREIHRDHDEDVEPHADVEETSASHSSASERLEHVLRLLTKVLGPAGFFLSEKGPERPRLKKPPRLASLTRAKTPDQRLFSFK